MRFLAEGEDSRARLAFSHEHGTPAVEGLQDADVITPASGQYLRFNGTSWANAAITDADLPSTITRDSEAILKTLVDAKGDLIIATAADTVARKAVGADGSFLKADSGQADGLAWDSNPILKTLVDAKGDLLVATGADAVTRLAIGTDTHVLTADSTQATGVKWAASSGGTNREPLTNGDEANPELVFASGDVIMVEV